MEGNTPVFENGSDGSPKSPTLAPAAPKPERKGSRRRAQAADEDGGRKKKEKKDIFADFVREAEEEMGSSRIGNETWQEDARKRLMSIHKNTRLLLAFSEDVELKDKKYTNNGHKVMMQSFMKDNRSRSDTQLVRDARRHGAAPEVFQVKKYNKELYVKPPTPPPVKVVEKPKVDESISGMFKRPTKVSVD